MGVCGHGARSSDSTEGESFVDHTIWDGELKAESVFKEMKWGGGGEFQVLEVGVRRAHLVAK